MSNYPSYADTLGILQGNGLDTRPVLYNNFTTLVFGTGRPYLIFLGGIPSGRCLKRQLRRTRTTVDPDNAIEFVKKQLDENRYVLMILNAKELSNVLFDREWFHDWVIFGYDDAKRVFSASGYDVDTKNHAFVHKSIEIGYDDFLCALSPKTVEPELIWIPTDAAPEGLNLRKIKRDVFLFGHNILPLVFNAKVYRAFAWLLRWKHHKTDAPFDMHQFRVLLEHKTLMRQMMCDLVPKSQAAEQYKIVQSRTNAMLMTALKYNMTKKNKQKALDAICATLAWLRKEEPPIFRVFYRELRAHEKK
ncbi:MAG: hypothetical protein LBJ12_06350 [Oscillospiraceae bacterium]|nr:hypothetical protein [Oscillospiraceae bacterium]